MRRTMTLKRETVPHLTGTALASVRGGLSQAGPCDLTSVTCGDPAVYVPLGGDVVPPVIGG